MQGQPGASQAEEAIEIRGANDAELESLRRELGRVLSLNASQLAVIAEYRRACDKIWPFVRYWGLCGASPQAVESALEIGRIAGKIDPAGQMSLEMAASLEADARRQAAGEIADHLESVLRGKVLAKNIPEIVESVRNLASCEPPN